MTDIEIARSTPLLPIAEVAQQIGIDAEQLEQYGKHVAKVPLSLIDESKVKRNHLILVTANVLLLRFVSLLLDLVLV